MFDRLRNYINDDSWKINISKNQVDIVNYLDIILLEEEKILVKYREGIISVTGDRLSVNKMMDSEILIAGNIKCVEFKGLY